MIKIPLKDLEKRVGKMMVASGQTQQQICDSYFSQIAIALSPLLAHAAMLCTAASSF